MNLRLPNMTSTSEKECRSICLAQVLQYFKIDANLDDIVKFCEGTEKFRDWDYFLGQYALSIGLNAVVHTRALGVFDSTWFDLNRKDLVSKLELKRKQLDTAGEQYGGFKKFATEAREAISFLKNGGSIKFNPISSKLIDRYLSRGIPVISTITGQLIYSMPKETKGAEDDIEGSPWKHSLVIGGSLNGRYIVHDPSKIIGRDTYSLSKDLLIDGVIRYDSNLLIIMPK